MLDKTRRGIRTDSFKGKRELWGWIWKKNRRRIAIFQSWTHSSDRNKPLLGGVSRFILSRTLKVAALGKVSSSVNLQLVILSFLAAPDAWHPCLSLFCSPLVASTPKTVKVSPRNFLFSFLFFFLLFKPSKSLSVVLFLWKGSLCSWFSPTPSSCWD